MKKCIRLDERDNVAMVLAQVEQGEEIEIVDTAMKRAGTIHAAQSIPFAHKIGLRDIDKDGDVIKYAQRIGRAALRIQKGEYVHVHNVISIEGSVNKPHVDRQVNIQ